MISIVVPQLILLSLHQRMVKTSQRNFQYVMLSQCLIFKYLEETHQVICLAFDYAILYLGKISFYLFCL